MPSISGALFDYLGGSYRDSFHWGPRQAAGLALNHDQLLRKRLPQGAAAPLALRHHQLHGGTVISQTISLQVNPSPDGVNQGQPTWYS